MSPEWSRPIRVDTIGEGERTVEIDAAADERRSLAARFGLLCVDRLEARLVLRREGGTIVASGTVTAEVTQACSLTNEPLPARIDEPMDLRFVEEIAGEDEVELSPDALDTLPIEGGAIDLGEAAAETMALALDPFPRAPGAEETLRKAGVISEDEVKPFNAFAALKGKLGG